MKPTTKNLNYLFNVEYYSKLSDANEHKKNVQRCNDLITDYRIESHSVELVPDAMTFDLKTIYPGLLIGLGNPHSSGMEANEVKLGFTFDYVTGAPYIPGSSVKGVLRSAFHKEGYILELLQNEYPEINVADLESSIFDHAAYNKKMKLCSKPSLLEKDIFYGAVIVAPVGAPILGMDVITPHKNLESPEPIKMIKVMPGVTFRFQFSIKDSNINNMIIPAKRKLELFQVILMDLGIGAKTNTGFGALIE